MEVIMLPAYVADTRVTMPSQWLNARLHLALIRSCFVTKQWKQIIYLYSVNSDGDNPKMSYSQITKYAKNKH